MTSTFKEDTTELIVELSASLRYRYIDPLLKPWDSRLIKNVMFLAATIIGEIAICLNGASNGWDPFELAFHKIDC